MVARSRPSRPSGETIETLRESVKTTFITYVWVVDGECRLLGIVTMRDLLFSDTQSQLRNVMLRGSVRAARARCRLMDAMKQVLDRHYPVYPVVDAAGA